MNPNDIRAAAARRLHADPALNTAVLAAWNRLLDDVEKRALAARPKPKVYEVHHETETARLAFLTKIAEGGSEAEAEAAGRARIGLEG